MRVGRQGRGSSDTGLVCDYARDALCVVGVLQMRCVLVLVYR